MPTSPATQQRNSAVLSESARRMQDENLDCRLLLAVPKHSHTNWNNIVSLRPKMPQVSQREKLAASVSQSGSTRDFTFTETWKNALLTRSSTTRTRVSL